jgi:hypothetical protein
MAAVEPVWQRVVVTMRAERHAAGRAVEEYRQPNRSVPGSVVHCLASGRGTGPLR